ECSDITVALDSNGMAMIENDTALDTLFDNCDMDPSGPFTMGGPTFRMFDCSFADSTVTRTVVATDMSGNQGSCDYEVTIIDTIAPVVVCSDTTIQLDADGAASLDELDLFTATDACGVDTEDNDSTFVLSCADVNNPIVFDIEIVDVNGNDTSCTVTITTQDTIAPVITVDPIDVTLDDNGNAVLMIDEEDAASDACGIESVTIEPTGVGCEDIGMFQALVTATDVNGNVAAELIDVTVDFIEPELGCINEVNVTLDEN
ncbi:hypothetical protein CEQ90_20590, partial [Lewinellaceae bacterium SD302]